MGSCSSCMILIFGLFLSDFVSLTCSKLLLFPLTHSLSNSNTTQHLLKSTSSRSAKRFLNHQVSVALSPGSDYTMSFLLGSSSVPVTLYMDTGSDTVWVPCKPFTCIMCEGKTTLSITPHDILSASPVSCQSRACSSVHSGVPTSDLCAMARCPLESIEMSECFNNSYSCPPFYYAYGDGSFVARLYTDTFQIKIPMSNLVINNFTFGCAHEALGEPIGVAGFGRGPLSFPAQLSHFSPHLGTQFSYCLVSHSFDTNRLRQPSPLILGRRSPSHLTDNKAPKSNHDHDHDDDFVYTPMLQNSKHPYYYYVGLEAITVGNRRLPAPETMKTIDRKGNGGMVVDSGTTYSMLPQGFYNLVVSEFGKRVNYKRAKQVEDQTGLSPCYYVNPNGRVPHMVLHFGGNSSVVMPTRNYFYEFIHSPSPSPSHRHRKREHGERNINNVGCMMLMNGGYFPGSDSGGPAGLLGNYQQQGLEVVYDLLNKRLGFANRKCASLWDTLS